MLLILNVFKVSHECILNSSRLRCCCDRDAGSQSEWGVLRESLYNDVIINAAQHPMFTETR